MSPTLKVWCRSVWRFPRVSGDEPGTDLAGNDQTAFSPRERG